MKSFNFQFFLLVLSLTCANACFVSSRKEPEPTNAATPPNYSAEKDESANSVAKANNEIRRIDFQNFTYEPNCAGEETQKITVKNGEYSLVKDEFDRLYFNVMDVTYGDVNSDQNEEAIILTNCNTGGTGQFSEGFIFGLKDGKAELLARIAGGDRAYGGLRKAKVENGLLVVERNDAGEAGASCCPEFVVTTKYKLEGNNLKQVGGDERRELYPARRVKFEKGASDTTINVELTKEEDVKRFIIGAQKNQLLRVESSSKDVSITLVTGNADIIEDGRSFQASLKESGDFVVQIQNLGDKEHTVSINIEIR